MLGKLALFLYFNLHKLFILYVILSLINFFIFMGDIFTALTSTLRPIVNFNVLAPFTSKFNLPFIYFLLIGTSFWFMFYLRFINFSKFKDAFALAFGSGSDKEKKHDNGKNGVSSLKSLFSIIAGSAGLGTIVGVPTLSVEIGPGVAFWILLVPFIGMSLRFAEVWCGHKYRVKSEDGSYNGSPSSYIKIALSQIGFKKIGSFLAIVYVLGMLIGGFVGPSSYQSNQVVDAICNNFDCLVNSRNMVAIIVAVIVGLVTFRGQQSIMNFLSFMAPCVIVIYMLGIMFVMFKFNDQIGHTLKIIMEDAFKIKTAVVGSTGTIGLSILFSRVALGSEIGLGTASTMHSNSENKDSVREGIISMCSPFISIFFISFFTIFIIVLTGSHVSGNTGIRLVQMAFAKGHPQLIWIAVFMTVIMGMNVMIAWSAYGVRNTQSLFSGSESAGRVYWFVYIVAIYIGGIVSNFTSILHFSDIANQIAIIPHCIALIMLTKVIRHYYLEYDARSTKK
ncbi:alanine:cation symporter family protein [Rickettsiales bacterium]|nr:alanine:cation symporter family protein [Rickettsiales bacterium]